MSFKRNLSLTSGVVICMFVASGARAQEMNYGALSEMFGEPVTTSATGSPQKASQAPADMQIISADQIRQSGAIDIPGILRFVAGIDVRNYGAADSDVSIRGFSQVFNPRLLVLINGRQVYLDDYGFTAWQTLPVQLADIRQIEVVRGPESALFGFNAASGVINIITYDPLFDRTNVFNFGLGTDGTYTGSLVSTLNIPGKAGITVQLGGVKTDEYNTGNLGGVTSYFQTRPKYGSYAIDGRYKPTANTEVTLELTEGQADAASAIPNDLYLSPVYRPKSAKAGFSADTEFGVLSLVAYENKTTTTYVQSPSLVENETNQISVVQMSDLFKIADNHAFRLGLEYRDNRAYGQFLNGTTGYKNYAASAMWNWQINPALAFTAAGRVDHLVLSRTDPLVAGDKYTPANYKGPTLTEPSYNFGLVWQPTANDTIRLLTGQAVQAPSLLDYGIQLLIPAGPVTVVDAGSPNLKAAITTNYETDYDRALPALNATLHGAVFYNLTRDLLTSSAGQATTFTPPSYLVAYSANIGNGSAAGGELGLQSSNDGNWRWNISYSLVTVRTKLSTPPPPLTVNSFNNSTPTSAIDFGLGYSWRQWEADLNGKWQSNYTDYKYVQGETGVTYQPVYIANYITLNARIGYQVTPHLTLAVSGQQLAQQQTIETYGEEPERRVLVSATVNF